MSTFSVELKEILPGIPVVSLIGYFAKEGGAKLRETIEPLLKARKVDIVLDLSRCQVITSPGIAALLDLLMLINDDFKGRCVMCGLDPTKKDFLLMTGVLPMAELAANPKEASETIQTGS